MHRYSVVWTKNAQFDLELIIGYIKLYTTPNKRYNFFQTLIPPTPVTLSHTFSNILRLLHIDF